MSGTDLAVHGVTKQYRHVGGRPRRWGNIGWMGRSSVTTALADVTFTVGRGETFGVVGDNGSGKSTLLRVMSGLTAPSVGTVERHRSIGGHLALGDTFNHLLTGEENALTGAMLSGLGRRDADLRIADIATFSGLEDHLDQPLRTYSTGMRLRLAFAVAVMCQPPILLLDEILAVGDVQFQKRCLERIDELRSGGTTVVMTSHDLGQIRGRCDRALWLVTGQVRALGDARAVVDEYQDAVHTVAYDAQPIGGAVAIQQVEVRDAGGRPTAAVDAGRPLTIDVVLQSDRERDVLVSVAVRPEDSGTKVLDLNNDADQQPVRLRVGTTRLLLEIEHFDLTSGTYDIDVGVYEPGWTATLDFAGRASTLEVRARTSTGLVAPPVNWRVR